MKPTERFADLRAEEGCGGNQYIVSIITSAPDDWGIERRCYEEIVLVRPLTEAEQKRLYASKTRDEIMTLLECVININEPTYYECDLRG